MGKQSFLSPSSVLPLSLCCTPLHFKFFFEEDRCAEFHILGYIFFLCVEVSLKWSYFSVQQLLVRATQKLGLTEQSNTETTWLFLFAEERHIRSCVSVNSFLSISVNSFLRYRVHFRMVKKETNSFQLFLVFLSITMWLVIPYMVVTTIQEVALKSKEKWMNFLPLVQLALCIFIEFTKFSFSN